MCDLWRICANVSIRCINRLAQMASTYTIGLFELRPSQRVLLCQGRPCRIGGRAFDILVHLVENRHRTVSQQELLDHVWPGLAVEPNNLQVQIWTVRRLIGRESIVTVPRGGYRFVALVAEDPLATRSRVRLSPANWARPGAAPSQTPDEPAEPVGSCSSQRARLRWNPRVD